jgi:hypothetical protein
VNTPALALVFIGVTSHDDVVGELIVQTEK